MGREARAMNRWVARIVGLILIILFSLMLLMIYKQLVSLQRAQQPATTTSSR
jgi:uncharacterized integral membrane protein